MEQIEARVSETTVVGRSYRCIIPKFLPPYNWYITDPTFLAKKIK